MTTIRIRTTKVLCTLGPASLNAHILARLQERRVDLFRINLSHTPLERIASTIEFIQAHSHVPVCLDTEGAQVRTGLMVCQAEVANAQRVRLTAEVLEGTSDVIPLTPPSVFDALEPGHLVSLDFDGATLLVLAVDAEGAEAVAVNGGKVGSNKAVVVTPPPLLPPLSDKDVAAVEIAKRYGVTHFALSFANSADDVQLLRELAGAEVCIISKIESKRGVQNLDEILDAADEILIDRGDLSREVPLENIPLLQKAIIRKANIVRKPVNVATNLLESMLVNRKPTRAELNDIINTLLDGADGLVLAAETAIGQHPVGAVDMVLNLIDRFRFSSEGYRIGDLLDGGPSLLPALHGRTPLRPLTPRRVGSLPHLARLPGIELGVEAAMDLQQLIAGVYSPLGGFMTQDELESVLDRHRLPGGDVWTMPIVLQGRSQEFAAFHPGQTVRLIDRRSGEAAAVMHIEDKFEIDRNSVAQRWFGTTDLRHPGVKRFVDQGLTLLGGPVEPLAAPVDRSPYELTPAQMRTIFDVKGWSKVVAFHTRNVPHRGHEHIIAHAAERCHADGVLIHPVIGPKKAGDFAADAILGAYEKLIRVAYPNALLAAFATYSRYAGPREAVFTALCRKNFGCTHFVIGRDHTGVGKFYEPHQNRALFEQLGDIGIAPVFFDTVYFSEEQDGTVEAPAQRDGLREISGTRIRDLLSKGEPAPAWCMRTEVSQWLTERAHAATPLFVGAE